MHGALSQSRNKVYGCDLESQLFSADTIIRHYCNNQAK